MADVFISYSRNDRDFVHRLHDALTKSNRDTWVDWEGIYPTEEWMDKVRSAIDSAQAFVFLISPDSSPAQPGRSGLCHVRSAR